MRSRVAGALAACLWALNTNAVLSVAWASAYNEVLCSMCILGAFYSRLRMIETGGRAGRWRVAEWAFYLAGFGVLEIMIVYPFLAALHAACVARKFLRETALLLVPAAAFTLFHYLLVPWPTSATYRISGGQKLVAACATYVQWTLEPRKRRCPFALRSVPGARNRRGDNLRPLVRLLRRAPANTSKIHRPLLPWVVLYSFGSPCRVYKPRHCVLSNDANDWRRVVGCLGDHQFRAKWWSYTSAGAGPDGRVRGRFSRRHRS